MSATWRLARAADRAARGTSVAVAVSLVLAIGLAPPCVAAAPTGEPTVPVPPEQGPSTDLGSATPNSTKGLETPADATPAADSMTERVLVLPLRAGATVDPSLLGELQAALERGLGRGRLLPFRDAQADACGDDACIRSRAAIHGARYVLRSRVEERERNFTTVLELLDAGTLAAVAEARRDCEVCGSAELLETLADQGAALAARPVVAAPRLGTLVLRTRPAGARARVDGEAVGSTPLRHEVAAGRHRVAFDRAGFVAVERDVVATAGVEELVEVELPRGRRPLRIAGAVLLGAGLGAAGAGGALLGFDGRPDRSRCTGDDVDFAGRCRFSFETTAAGAATTAGGLALVATGIALLVVDARRNRAR